MRSRFGKEMRDQLANYFIQEGAVGWQNEAVGLGRE